MKEELIFHLVSRNKWKEGQKEGMYQPEDFEEKQYISCSDGSQIQSVANQKFKDIEDLLMLVIDPTRVNANVTYVGKESEDVEVPRIQGPINTDAVIDKIELAPNDEGEFEIQVESS